MANELTTTTATQVAISADAQAFELAQRQAKALASSDLVPEQYKGKTANCLIALEISHRTGASALMVMQNLNIIHGRPAWSSQYIISAVNACGRFSPLRFRMTGEGDGRVCVAWAKDKSGEVLEGPPASIKLAKEEGWFQKNGSKWKTMPENMLMYRAASFFGRLYAPDILMGMKSQDEISDMIDVTPQSAELPDDADSFQRAAAGVVDNVDSETGEITETKPVDETNLFEKE
jgi:hypothetical protein